MSFLTTVLAEAETHVELPMPAWAFGAIAIVYDVLKPEQPAAPDGRAP